MENLQELDKSLEKKKDRREYRILRKEIKEEKLRSCKVERFFKKLAKLKEIGYLSTLGKLRIARKVLR